jgi:hypothetical protein
MQEPIVATTNAARLTSPDPPDTPCPECINPVSSKSFPGRLLTALEERSTHPSFDAAL